MHEHLSSSGASPAEHGEVDNWLKAECPELMRLMFQEHVLRAAAERRVHAASSTRTSIRAWRAAVLQRGERKPLDSSAKATPRLASRRGELHERTGLSGTKAGAALSTAPCRRRR